MNSVRGRPFETRHGHASWRGKSPTYQAWVQMKMRCEKHPHYIKRGIKLCERWERFENFLTDMGERHPGMSVDRINNSLGYEPSNCRWATKVEQMNNQTKNIFIEAFGERKTVAMWSRDSRCVTGYAGLYKRILRGVKPEVAITTPNRKACGVMTEEGQ